jgi:hypothetical protein
LLWLELGLAGLAGPCVCLGLPGTLKLLPLTFISIDFTACIELFKLPDPPPIPATVLIAVSE